jgi:hypothetical protein
MLYCAVERLRLGLLSSNVQVAIRNPFSLVLAVIAAVLNVKITKHPAGWIGNSLNYCLLSILW